MKSFKDSYISDIVKQLKTLDPIQISLFGSRATDNYREDSDIDILIVLNINTVPNTYDDKIDLRLQVRKTIRSISKEVAIDLLVYTIPEYKELIDTASSFAQEITQKGIVLYEKAS